MPFGRCTRCGWLGLVHEHHDIPRSDGGEDNADNLLLLCPNCHADAHCQSAYQLNTFGESRDDWLEAQEHGVTLLPVQLYERLQKYHGYRIAPPYTIAVYMILKRHTLNSAGYVGITIQEVADYAGISAGSASKSIKDLEELSLLRKVKINELRERLTQ